VRLFRRLSSTFPGGWPGIGLLLMRLVASFTLVDHGITGLRGGPPLERAVAYLLAIGAGVLLLAGLWTRFAGAVAAAIELWFAFSQPADPLTHIPLVTLVGALALIGPGAWSVDARVFGWKRINIPNHKG
jgi:putative oxidoreductase